MAKTYMTGLDQVLRNLAKEVQKIEGRTLKGLIRSAVIVRRSMDKVSPKIPVDTGNLRSSYFVISSEGKTQVGNPPTEAAGLSVNTNNGPFVVLGFGANYALYVHEMLGKTGRAKRGLRFSRKGIGSINWNRTGSGPKFLENALDRNILSILYMIGKEARIR